MRLALVTTPPTPGSGVADYVRRLVPPLAQHAEIEVFVEPGREGAELAGLVTRSVAELSPRDHDQILYQLGNEPGHAFMVPLVRALGGAVVLHDWVLFDLALAAWPALGRAGLRGLATAVREGGLSQAAVWWTNRMQRRAQQRRPLEPIDDPSFLRGGLLWGWHDPEPGGRWTADVAQLRPPPDVGTRVRLRLSAGAARRLRVWQAGVRVAERDLSGSEEVELTAPLSREHAAELLLEVEDVAVGARQRRAGDGRRLGVFVREVAFEVEGGWRSLDLSQRAAAPLRTVDLARDRFELPLNRGIVRFADAFVVHSEHVAELVRADRNAPTPIGLVRHGADPQWSSEDRRLERERLGLPADWREAFLLTSLGTLRTHKRLEVVLEALAMARRSRPSLRLVLVGAEHPGELDVRALASRLDLADAVRLTGHLEPDQARRWIRAGDLGVQLRGPSTGRTSGSLVQTLALGRGVIASALDEQKELPDECVFKLHPGQDEAARLAHKLLDLHDSPAVRAAMEQAAREFVEGECRWERVAARYAELLGRFPRARASRRSLWALRFEHAAREGWARGRSGAG